jgi:hypothetical protein
LSSAPLAASAGARPGGNSFRYGYGGVVPTVVDEDHVEALYALSQYRREPVGKGWRGIADCYDKAGAHFIEPGSSTLAEHFEGTLEQLEHIV